MTENKELIEEISYNILQNEYLKRNKVNFNYENIPFQKIEYCFPEDWFIKYPLKYRIDILSYALKNNIDLETSLEKNIIGGQK